MKLCLRKNMMEIWLAQGFKSVLPYIGCGPLPVAVTTRIITFLVGDRYKPSFHTVTSHINLLLAGGFNCLFAPTWGNDPIWLAHRFHWVAKNQHLEKCLGVSYDLDFSSIWLNRVSGAQKPLKTTEKETVLFFKSPTVVKIWGAVFVWGFSGKQMFFPGGNAALCPRKFRND